ncbi:MAG: BtrH N-terminal domain-containing protein [Acetobacteraceae bacterium]|nr:BtrH N-terminal domain-containing protein [Acetobacteraceae bacterium]
MPGEDLRRVAPYISDYISCETQCVAGVLQHLGQGPLELLYGKDWAFYHWQAPGPDGEHFVLASWRKPDEDFRAEHGIRLKVRRTRDARRAWKGVQNLLDRGRPAVVLANTYYLPQASGYGVRHSLHFLIVNGYDPEKREVYVADGLFNFVGALPYSVLAEVRGRAGDGCDPANKWLEIEPATGPRPDLRALVAGALRRNLRAMLGSRPPALTRAVREPLDRRRARLVGAGLGGLRAFARMMGGCPLPSQKVLMSLFNQLVAFCEKRMWHSQFLAYAGKELGLSPLVEAGRVLAPLAQGWMVVRNLIFKAAHAQQVSDIQGRIEGRLLDIADTEERALGLVQLAARELREAGR